jgi:hypothetical protein
MARQIRFAIKGPFQRMLSKQASLSYMALSKTKYILLFDDLIASIFESIFDES